MSEDYYARKRVVHTDGTGIFQSDDDRASERRVADILERKWKCQIRSFGALAPIDWWAGRHERLLAVIEIKHRSHNYGAYPTVFLNVRKWLALNLAAAGLGVPAFFVVEWKDRLAFVGIGNVDATKVRIGGCHRVVKSENDIEPIIEVPIDIFTVLQDNQNDDLSP